MFKRSDEKTGFWIMSWQFVYWRRRNMVLAMSGINGYGYGIPINYVKEGDSIYFHCAPEGYKLECLRENPKVSFTVVGATQIVPGKFTTGYESTIAFERYIWICRKKSVGMPCGYS